MQSAKRRRMQPCHLWKIESVLGHVVHIDGKFRTEQGSRRSWLGAWGFSTYILYINLYHKNFASDIIEQGEDPALSWHCLLKIVQAQKRFLNFSSVATWFQDRSSAFYWSCFSTHFKNLVCLWFICSFPGSVFLIRLQFETSVNLGLLFERVEKEFYSIL